MTPTVVEITGDRGDEAVSVLVDSFADYPTMRYILGYPTPDYESRLRVLVAYFVQSRLETNGIVLGTFAEDDNLAAVALVDAPGGLPEEEAHGATGFRDRIGADATSRLSRFDSAITTLEPDLPFHYLGMIGVLVAHRGRGHSRSLIQTVINLSAAHSHSRGVLLTTEHAVNLGLYQAFGFELIGDVTTSDGDLRSWTLFRPDDSDPVSAGI